MREGDEAARLALARLRIGADEGVEATLRNATRISAQHLSCARVGVWLFTNGERDGLVSSTVYDLRRDQWLSDPQLIEEAQFPQYFQAIRGRRAVVAHDARRAEETAELAEPYLVPRGIVSILDVPIYGAGEVIGVVCHEHIGEPRRWSDAEVAFAASVADVLAVMIERCERLALERELHARERANIELRHAAELARIAGGVGHDLNNLFTVIVTGSDVLEAALRALPSQLTEQVAAIHEAATRGSSLAKQLLELGRGLSRSAVTPCDVRGTITSMTPILRQLIPERRLTMDVTGEPLLVDAGAADVERIVVNLVSNARDAIGPEGKVSLSVRGTDAAAIIAVRDDGPGIPEETRAHLFEPFFTTKPRGAGTGLGLAIVAAIARRAGGDVTVESIAGEGTTFEVRLARSP